MKRSQKGRKYYRKCGVCGERHEQSEMIRTNDSENGIARRVFAGGHELPHVMSVNIRYGICMYPIVTVAFMANSVTIEEGVKE